MSQEICRKTPRRPDTQRGRATTSPQRDVGPESLGRASQCGEPRRLPHLLGGGEEGNAGKARFSQAYFGGILLSGLLSLTWILNMN